jgi:phosphatidylglycerol---prolipoprotein diacylglyceryl transferase
MVVGERYAEDGIAVDLPAANRLSAALNWMGRRVVLFRRGDLILVTYGLFAGLGAVFALAWLSVLLLGQGVSPLALVAFVGGGSVGALVLSRLAGLALDYRLLRRDPGAALRSAHFVSWGGIVAIALSTIAFSAVTGHPLLPLMDAVVRAGPLGHAIGRLGCLFYGCCYGRPTTAPLAITYTNPGAKAVRVGKHAGVPLHPVPLYEAGWSFGIFVFVNIIAFQGAPQGMPAAAYLLLYGIGRFLMEFARDNQSRAVWRGLAVNHLLSLVAAAFGLVLVAAALGASTNPVDLSLATGVRETIPVVPFLWFFSALLFLGFSLQRKDIGRW